MNDEQLLGVVSELYEAALNAEHWPRALESLQILLQGGAYAHFLWDKQTGKVPLMYFAGFSQEVIAAYHEYYSTIEPGADFIRSNGNLPLLHDYLWTDDRAMDRNEYHAWLERESGMRYRLGGFVANSDRFFGITAVQRSRRQGPASEADQKSFLRILPHICRATRLSQEFANLRTDNQALIETLQHARCGLLLLDEGGRVVFSNRSAEVLLAQRDGLWLDRAGCLNAVRTDERSELGRLIAATAVGGGSSETRTGGTLAVTRISGRRPYTLTVAPFRFSTLEFSTRPAVRAVVFLNNPDSTLSPTDELLRQVYGLTPAEIRLIVNLLKTESLKETALALGLTEASARQTLKRVFSKTDCHSQAALMKFLLMYAQF